MVLACAALGDAYDIQVRARVALGAVLAPHQRTDGTQARSQRQHGLGTLGRRRHERHHVGNHAAHLVPARRQWFGRWQHRRYYRSINRDRVLCLQRLQHLLRRVVTVHHNFTIELQVSIRNPAVVQRQLVDGARPNALGSKTGPAFGGGLGIVLGGRRRPGLKERPAFLSERPFDGHADAHPAVVVQVLVGDVLQCILDCLKRAALLGQIGKRHG